jgi:hypothetical protein
MKFGGERNGQDGSPCGEFAGNFVLLPLTSH